MYVDCPADFKYDLNVLLQSATPPSQQPKARPNPAPPSRLPPSRPEPAASAPSPSSTYVPPRRFPESSAGDAAASPDGRRLGGAPGSARRSTPDPEEIRRRRMAFLDKMEKDKKKE